EAMEVTNGGASDVFGNGALGGVVNLRARSAEEAYASGEVSYGSMSTPDVSFAVGVPVDNWSLAAAGQALRTGGYILVPPDQRGSVDTDAGTADLAGTLEVSRNLGEQGRFFVRGSGFGESRRNGTPLQLNDTTIPEVDLGLDWTTAHAGSFSARLYGSTEIYHQSLSAVATDRNSETLTDLQRNPSQQIGFVGTWTRLFEEKHKVAGGIEASDVRGQSEDTNYHSGAPFTLVAAGVWRTRGHLEQQHRLPEQPAADDRDADDGDVCEPVGDGVQPTGIAAAKFFARAGVERFGVPGVPRAHLERVVPEFPRGKRPNVRQSGFDGRTPDGWRGGAQLPDVGKPADAARKFLLERHC